MRAIDADALKDAFEEDGHLSGYIEEYINEQPTLSPDDVRGVGEWKEIEVMPKAYDLYGVQTWASKMRCCNCGFVTYAIEGHFGQYIYCPSCGARLLGGNDDS